MTLRDQLMRDEGLKLFPYHDTTGNLTVGFGRNLGERGISSAEAEIMLDNDIASTIREVEKELPWVADLDPARHAVIIGMAFNLGLVGLLAFRRMLRAVEAREWAEAAAHMLDSLWAHQVGERASRLSRQMHTGEWT